MADGRRFTILAVGEDALHAVAIHEIVDRELARLDWPQRDELDQAREWISRPQCDHGGACAYLKLTSAKRVAREEGYVAYRRASDWDGPVEAHTADLVSALRVGVAWEADALVALRDTDHVRLDEVTALDDHLSASGQPRVIGAAVHEAEAWLIIAAPDQALAPLLEELRFDVRMQPERLRSKNTDNPLDTKRIAERLGIDAAWRADRGQVAAALERADAHPKAPAVGLTRFVGRVRAAIRPAFDRAVGQPART